MKSLQTLVLSGLLSSACAHQPPAPEPSVPAATVPEEPRSDLEGLTEKEADDLARPKNSVYRRQVAALLAGLDTDHIGHHDDEAVICAHSGVKNNLYTDVALYRQLYLIRKTLFKGERIRLRVLSIMNPERDAYTVCGSIKPESVIRMAGDPGFRTD